MLNNFYFKATNDAKMGMESKIWSLPFHFCWIEVEGYLWTSVSFKNICAADNDNYKRQLHSFLKIQQNCR